MKKNILRILALSLAASAFLSSCIGEKENPYKNEATPELSLTTASTAFVNDEAQLELQLSDFIHKDVLVSFGVEGIERAAIDLPESFTFEAGAIKKVIPVTIDEDETTLGTKNVVINITGVENATLAQSSVTIPITVEDKARVEVTTMGFDENKTAKIDFTLSKRLTTDVTLTIGLASSVPDDKVQLPEANLAFERSVTIPAGSHNASLVVTADTKGLPEGAYEADIEVTGFDPKVSAGKRVKAALPINVGFQPILVSYGTAYFQYYSQYWYVNYDNVESHDSYFLWPELASSGSLSDPTYVKAALYRCRDFIQKQENRDAVQAFWAYYAAAGYASSIPSTTPISVSEIGYRGWPMLYVDGEGVKDLTPGETYHVFMVGFDAELNVCEEYFVISYTEE